MVTMIKVYKKQYLRTREDFAHVFDPSLSLEKLTLIRYTSLFMNFRTTSMIVTGSASVDRKQNCLWVRHD